jgi:hypothetical protein
MSADFSSSQYILGFLLFLQLTNPNAYKMRMAILVAARSLYVLLQKQLRSRSSDQSPQEVGQQRFVVNVLRHDNLYRDTLMDFKHSCPQALRS